MNNNRALIVTCIVLLAAAGWLSFDAIREWWAVDRCLDAGGAWGYESSRCQMDSARPSVGRQAKSEKNHGF